MYLVYGDGPCMLCNAPDATHEIRETPQSRFKLMQFMAEISTRLTPGEPPVITGASSHNFMLGLLMCGGNTLVAASGNNDNKPFLIDAAQRMGYTHCVRHTGPMVTRTDRQLTSDEVASCEVQGASGPGFCAAPKLISAAISLGYHRNTPVAQWQMSEIMFQPNTERRTRGMERGQVAYDHGLSQASCATCRNLIPMLMCRH